MTHFAKVVEGNVSQVIVAEPDFFDTFVDSSPGEWVQTSYNTVGGVHLYDGAPLRMNYAGIGDVYDKELDAFYVQQPYPSWYLDTETCLWEAPTPRPEGSWEWDEPSLAWLEISAEELT